jgi:hypothetical protein
MMGMIVVIDMIMARIVLFVKITGSVISGTHPIKIIRSHCLCQIHYCLRNSILVLWIMLS